jgi:glycosyltransferase involved in cell wall biosynthesis
MRILHVPYSFFPDPPGGTEVYVAALANYQRSSGCEVGVAAPAAVASQYDHSGIPVWRFPVSANLDLRELYGEGDKTAAEAFGAILDEFGPDVVHLHAMTSAVSVRLAGQVAERGIPILLNYHTPTVSCSRGTLLKRGSEICDGLLDRRVCAACVLDGRGLPRPLAKLIASMPVSASVRLGQAGFSGRATTALRMPELIDLRIGAFHRMMHLCDRVIALCDWSRELLQRNGVPEEKIILCRQGIAWSSGDAPAPLSRPATMLPLHAAFLGRLDAAKGAHIVAEALNSDPDLPIELDLFGIAQGEGGDGYATRLQAAIGDDRRIRLLPAIPGNEVVGRLREYDFIVVPSQCLETGPLVVLEAFAAGTPPIGSNLGGIAELVKEGVNGLLVSPAAAPSAWANVLQRLVSNPDLLNSLRDGIRPPRHMRQVAMEIIPVYEDVVRQGTRAVCAER